MKGSQLSAIWCWKIAIGTSSCIMRFVWAPGRPYCACGWFRPRELLRMGCLETSGNIWKPCLNIFSYSLHVLMSVACVVSHRTWTCCLKTTLLAVQVSGASSAEPTKTWVCASVCGQGCKKGNLLWVRCKALQNRFQIQPYKVPQWNAIYTHLQSGWGEHARNITTHGDGTSGVKMLRNPWAQWKQQDAEKGILKLKQFYAI